MSTTTRRLRGLCVPVLIAAGVAAGCGSSGGGRPVRTGPAATASPAAAQAATRTFRALESRYGARLGVYVLDTGTGRTVTYRDGERFAYASTLKAITSGLLLRRDSDAQLDTLVRYGRADLLAYAPVTEKHVATGMTVRELIAAALDYSDNTAANLLMTRLGGPAGVQRAVRALGDTTTHVDRTEPSLNTAIPGDVRDTSTPRQLATDLRSFALGDLLTAERRTLYTGLLAANTTGGPFVRAGVPAGWRVGDKTGNGDHGTRNDIAVAWPPGRGPVVISILTERRSATASSGDALIADATRTAIGALG